VVPAAAVPDDAGFAPNKFDVEIVAAGAFTPEDVVAPNKFDVEVVAPDAGPVEEEGFVPNRLGVGAATPDVAVPEDERLVPNKFEEEDAVPGTEVATEVGAFDAFENRLEVAPGVVLLVDDRPANKLGAEVVCVEVGLEFVAWFPPNPGYGIEAGMDAGFEPANKLPWLVVVEDEAFAAGFPNRLMPVEPAPLKRLLVGAPAGVVEGIMKLLLVAGVLEAGGTVVVFELEKRLGCDVAAAGADPKLKVGAEVVPETG
jgi:hypothetical protein